MKVSRERYIGFLNHLSNFGEWPRVWKMNVSQNYPYKADLLTFANRTQSRFFNLAENKIDDLGSVKLQFGTWNTILSKTNLIFSTETIRKEFNRFIDQVEGEIEA